MGRKQTEFLRGVYKFLPRSKSLLSVLDSQLDRRIFFLQQGKQFSAEQRTLCRLNAVKPTIPADKQCLKLTLLTHTNTQSHTHQNNAFVLTAHTDVDSVKLTQNCNHRSSDDKIGTIRSFVQCSSHNMIFSQHSQYLS